MLFPLGAQLFIDREGYLAYGRAEARGYARVGEDLIFMGSIGEVTAPELVKPVHAACGAGKVIKVNAMRSAAADRAQGQLSANSASLSQLKEMYGLSEGAARRALDHCKKQARVPTCLMTPPRPVMRQEECPPGTKLSSGLCRTGEGYIRPLPQWLPKWLQPIADSGS